MTAVTDTRPALPILPSPIALDAVAPDHGPAAAGPQPARDPARPADRDEPPLPADPPGPGGRPLRPDRVPAPRRARTPRTTTRAPPGCGSCGGRCCRSCSSCSAASGARSARSAGSATWSRSSPAPTARSRSSSRSTGSGSSTPGSSRSPGPTTCSASSSRPWGSGVLLLIMTTAVIVSGAFFARRTFCRYLCFLGGLSGNYARTGVVALRANTDICATCDAKAACFNGTDTTKPCPLFTFPRTMDSNAACNLCAECVKSCPNDAITISVRKPTSRAVVHPQAQGRGELPRDGDHGHRPHPEPDDARGLEPGPGLAGGRDRHHQQGRDLHAGLRDRDRAPRSRCWRSPPGSRAAATPSPRGRTSPASATR